MDIIFHYKGWNVRGGGFFFNVIELFPDAQYTPLFGFKFRGFFFIIKNVFRVLFVIIDVNEIYFLPRGSSYYSRVLLNGLDSEFCV